MMTDSPLYVIFAGSRPDFPFMPIMVKEADTLEESVKLRALDGSTEVVYASVGPDMLGPITLKLRWLGCLDHPPSEEEVEAMSEALIPLSDDE